MIIERIFQIIERMFLISKELTKEDAAYIAVIISMLVASVLSFSVGSSIADFLEQFLVLFQ